MNNSIQSKGRLDVLLEQEINLMSVLDHPNLIRFYGAFQEDAQLNIFIEWMPGGSVSRLLDKHGPFNDKVIANYTFQILKGLDYLHSRGILHRDIKGTLFDYKVQNMIHKFHTNHIT